MLQYIMAAILAVVAMGRKGRARRKFRRYLKGQIDFELSLGTLGANDTISGTIADTLEESAWLSSVRALWSIIDFTVGTADGPIMVGISHSDYSGTEIEEWIEVQGSWKSGDKIAQEIARRKIRKVGVFMNLSTATAGTDVLNEGRPITTKCNWLLTTGQTVRFWAYNTGTGTLTTGSFLHVNGHANLWPN